MLKNLKRGYVEEQVRFELTFDNGEGTSGFAFPCDPAGNIKKIGRAGRKSLDYCLTHPEEFSRRNEVVRRVIHVHIPTSGTCICGRGIVLCDQYRGAYRCSCGRWYDAQDGRELVDPEYWSDEG